MPEVFYHTTGCSRPRGVHFGHKLTIPKLFELRDGDVVIFDRLAPLLCWFIEFICRKDIKFVYVSDGVLSSLQRLKGRGLFAKSFFDCFIIDQPACDSLFQTDVNVINLMENFGVTKVNFEGDSLVLLLANDPYLGLSNSEFLAEFKDLVNFCSKNNITLKACYGRKISKAVKQLLSEEGVPAVQFIKNCPQDSFYVSTASSAVITTPTGAFTMLSSKLCLAPFDLIGFSKNRSTFYRVRSQSRELTYGEMIGLRKVSHHYSDYLNFHFILRFFKDLMLLCAHEK